jgi:hypothetical protein
VPWHSPVFAARAVEAGAPKAPVVVLPKGVLEVVLPKGFDVVVVPDPKPGLFPNKPPPVFWEPKAEVVEGAVEPNPPKPVLPDVAVPLPNRPPPAVVVVLPNPPCLLPPNALFCADPKPGRDNVSFFVLRILRG